VRVLIVEDNVALIPEYLRIFKEILGDGDTYTHVASVHDAIESLFEENWDVILVDTDLGVAGKFKSGIEGGDELTLRNGYDLVRFRRRVEQLESDRIVPAKIIGLAPNRSALPAFDTVGTNHRLFKLDIPGIAKQIRAYSDEVQA